MVFAPKLDAGISYERPQQVAPPVDYGKALTSGVSDVLKVIDDATPDKPTWSQVKDEQEAAGLRAFNRKLGIVDQLRDQGFAREAASKGRALVDWAAGRNINMADPQITAQLKARDITLDTLGETPEDTRTRKLRETPAWKQAETLVLGDPKNDKYSPQQKQNEIERITAQTLLDEATISQSSQSDIANWHRNGAPAVDRMMKLNVESQVLEAQTAARLGIPIDPTSLEAKLTELTFSLAKLNSVFPAGLPQAEKDKAMAPLKGSIKVIEKLQSRGERISAGAVGNLTAALAGNTDEKSIAVVALLAGGMKNLTPEVIELILDKGKGSVDAVLKTLSNPDAPTFYFGAGQSQWGYGKRVRLPGGVLRKTLEEPTGTSAAAMANSAERMASLLSAETLRQNKNADPRVLLQNFNKNALTLGEMIQTPDSEEAAAFNFGLAANAAAAVFHSPETFSAADVLTGYSPSFFKNLEGASTLYPGQAGSLVQANLIAVRQMNAKAAARLESVTKGWLQYSGTTLLLDYDKITTQEYSVGGNPEVQEQMKTEVKAAVEGAGGFSEFLKEYDNVSKGQAGRNPYSPLVKAFMMSKEVSDIRKDMAPISEQTKAVVALSQTAGRLQRLQDKIDKDFDERNFNNEVPDGEHVPLQPDEVRVNPAFIDQSAAVPDTNGVPLGERPVGKVGDALGDAASYVGDALISPAGAAVQNDNWTEAAKAAIKKHEGKRLEAYPDRGGYSIGYGRFGVLKNAKITDEQAERYFEEDFQAKVTAARKAIPKFDALSNELKAEITQGFFRGDLSGSPKTLALINEGKFSEAAVEFLDNNEYRNPDTARGVKNRMLLIANALELEGSAPVQSNSLVQPANAASGGLSGVEDAVQQAVTDNGLPPSQKEDFGRQLDNRAPIPPTRMGDPAPVPRKRPSESPTPGRNLPALDEGQSWLSRNVGQPLATIAVSLASQAAGAVGGPAFAFLLGDLLDAQLGGNWRSFDQTDMSPEYSTATHNAVKLAYANGKSKTTYGVWASMAVAYENQALVEQYYGGDLVAAAKDKLAKAPKADRPSFPTVQESLSWSPGGKGKVEATMTNPYINLMYTFGEAGFTKEGEGFRITDQYDNNWYRDYTRPSGNKAYTQVSTEEFEKFKGKRTLVQLFEESLKAYKDKKVSLFGLVHNSQYLFGSRDWTDDTKDESKKINMFFSGADKQTLSQKMSSTVRGHIAGE